MSNITTLYDAVKRGDLGRIKVLLDEDRKVANSVSETDARGTYPHAENDAIALGWAAFFGRPEVAAVLLEGGSDATAEDRRRAADTIRSYGGIE